MNSGSRLSRLNIMLAALTCVVLFCTWWMQVDYSKPNVEFLPDMKYTSAWLAFSANPHFENGRTLQRPVAGTIARGAMPLHYEATKEDAVRAGEELQNPYRVEPTDPATPGDDPATPDDDPATPDDDPDVGASPASAADEAGPSQAKTNDEQPNGAPPPPSPEVIAEQRLRQSTLRGGEVYNVFCVSCHGAAGAGDGPVAKRGFPPPASMLSGKSLQMKDGQLFHVLTYGQNSMPSFAAQLSRERRWDVINYVRDMQKSAPTPPARPSPEAEEPAAGSGALEPTPSTASE